jgi:molybdopterin converting factor small subunit|tara:strand:+ start:763 stop:1011 length:249 start_codon:yes stop_codon:yes gene_type:complete
LAQLILTGSLKNLTKGVGAFNIQAKNVHQLVGELKQICPVLAPLIESEGFAVAIDGEIYQDILFAPIGENSEVHLIPPIGGG